MDLRAASVTTQERARFRSSVETARGWLGLAQLSQELGGDGTRERLAALEALRAIVDDEELIDSLYGIERDEARAGA